MDTIYEIDGCFEPDTNHVVAKRSQRLGGSVNVLRNLRYPSVPAYIGPLAEDWQSKKPTGVQTIEDLGSYEAFIVEEPTNSKRSTFPFELRKPNDNQRKFDFSKVSVISYLDYYINAPRIVSSIRESSELVLADLAKKELSHEQKEGLTGLLDKNVDGLVCSDSEIGRGLSLENISDLVRNKSNSFQFAIIHSNDSVVVQDKNGISRIRVQKVSGVRATGLGDAFLAHFATAICEDCVLEDAVVKAVDSVRAMILKWEG